MSIMLQTKYTRFILFVREIYEKELKHPIHFEVNQHLIKLLPDFLNDLKLLYTSMTYEDTAKLISTTLEINRAAPRVMVHVLE